MEVYGITFTLWTIVKAALIRWLFSVLYDWLAELAWRRKYGLKGRFPFPIVGSLPYIFWKTRDELDKESLDKYGSLYAASVGKMKAIAVADIVLLKKILIKEHVQFQNRYTMDLLNPWPMSKTLMSLKDEQWRRVRSVVSPTFSAGKLKKMTKEMNYCAELLTSGLMEITKSGELIDSRKHFGCYTMDVIASTAFGVRTDSYNNPDDNIVSLAQKVFGTSTLNPMVLLACKRVLLSSLFISLTCVLEAGSITVSKDIFVKSMQGQLLDSNDRVNVSLSCTGSSSSLSYYITNRIIWDFIDKNNSVHAITESSFYLTTWSVYAEKNFNSGHLKFEYHQLPMGGHFNFKITLYGISREDTGIYRCTELYDKGTIIDTKNVSLTVASPVETLSLVLYNAGGFVVTESNSTTKTNYGHGHTVNIASGHYTVRCQATGSNPEPAMAFIYNGKETNLSVNTYKDTSVTDRTLYTEYVNVSVEANASTQYIACTTKDFYRTKEVRIFLTVQNVTATEKEFYECYWVNSVTVDCDLFFPDPRCGTDLVTYKNKCEISRAHCADNDIHLKHYGACS